MDSDAAAAVAPPECSCDQDFTLNGVAAMHRASCAAVACNCDGNYGWQSRCSCRIADYLACEFCMSGDPDDPPTGIHHLSCPQAPYIAAQAGGSGQSDAGDIA
jgi:hypothetical protein